MEQMIDNSIYLSIHPSIYNIQKSKNLGFTKKKKKQFEYNIKNRGKSTKDAVLHKLQISCQGMEGRFIKEDIVVGIEFWSLCRVQYKH